MKSVKNLVFALLLVFAITGTTSAGEVPIPPAPDPTAPKLVVAQDEGTTLVGDPYSEQSGDTVETSDYLLFETLAALLSVY
jgi:hypothetical protein